MSEIPTRPHPRLWILSTAAILTLLALPSVLPPDGTTHAGQLLGRLHVGVIHLPIGLLVFLPVLEFAAWKRQALRVSAMWTLWAAAVSAVLSALLGIVLAHAGAFAAEDVRKHLWAGVVLAVTVLVFALVRPLLRPTVGAWLAVVLALGTIWTAHTGGTMVYGGDWFTEYMPNLSEMFGPSRNYPPVNPAGVYAKQVQPILEENCVKCHKPGKRGGGFAVDTYAHLMDGGHSGDVVNPGRVEHSILLQRLMLPETDKKFMPKEGHPLPATEIDILRAWIAAGASDTAMSLEMQTQDTH